MNFFQQRQVSSAKMAKHLMTLKDVSIHNVEATMVNMGLSLSIGQIREIKEHLTVESKNEEQASQVSVKTEPDAELAPPTPKISRKVNH